MLRLRLRPAAVLLLAAASLIACGAGDSGTGSASNSGTGSSDGNGGSSSGGNVEVTFASLSVAQAAPLVLGEQKGFFKDNGIDLSMTFVEAPAVVPGVLSGKYDFGYLAAPAVLAARANDVPIKSVITTSNNSGDPAQFPIQIVVPSDSDIKAPKDLVGKTVATDTLFQLPDLGMRGALLESGVDAQDLDVVEIPFPEMGAALQEGKVDAAVISEPFGSILRDAGAVRDLLSTSTGQPEGSPQSVLLSSEQFISQHQDTVGKFQDAVNDSLVYAADHEAEWRAVLPDFTPIEPELAKAVRLAPISSEDTPEGWQAWADLLVEVEVIDEAGDAAEAYVNFDG